LFSDIETSGWPGPSVFSRIVRDSTSRSLGKT
jgi:hypothetical protein